MPRRPCGLILIALAACGPDDAATETELVCPLEPPAEIHSASYTDETTHAYAPSHLVADADHVYFADGRAIHRVPRCGGAAEVWLADAHPFNDGLAIADGVLYWIAADDGTGVHVGDPHIVAAPAAGGEPVVLAEFAGYPQRLRVAGDTIVWSASYSGFPDEARIHAVDIDGSRARVLATHRYGWSFDLADDVIYAAGYLPGSDPAETDRQLFSLPVDGGPLTVLVDGFGVNYPSGVEVGGDDIYYFRSWSSDNLAVERVARTGGAPQVIDLGDARIPAELLYAGDRLYGIDHTGVVRIVDGERPTPLISDDALGVASRVYGDAGGLFVGDSTVTCIEWYMDPTGEPPGMSCVRETIDVRLLALGR